MRVLMELLVELQLRFVISSEFLPSLSVHKLLEMNDLLLVLEMGTKITSLVHASMFHDSDFTETFIDHLAPPASFSQIREMEYHHLFTEFNVGTAHQACLNAEARDDEVENLKAQLLLKETKLNVALENEKDSLDRKVIELQSSVSAKDLKLKDLNVAVSFLRSQNDGLVDQVHALETTCSSLQGPVAKLDGDLLEMALHLEEKFYPHLLTPISGWSHAIEKGMQDWNCRPALTTKRQRLRESGFPLLSELSSHKDTSTADIIDLLCLESLLADAPGMSDLQPDVEQVTLPIHRPEDQVVLGETSLFI
ncbi:hypothetical protein Tco_0714660 [Tanacetum coccineum]